MVENIVLSACKKVSCVRLLPILIAAIVFSASTLHFHGNDVLSDAGLEGLLFTREELGPNVAYYRVQSRNSAKDFKLLDYPIGEFGAKVDVGFFERMGFKRSVALEADLREYKLACAIFLFSNSSAAKSAYDEIVSFLSWRRTYDSFPYVWVPRWDDVEDIANHFITALYNNHPEAVYGLGEEAAHFHDQYNNFHYTIFRWNSMLLMVGVTGCEEKMLEYARRMEFKLIELWAKNF